jgi:soluble P-type ATPase
MLRLDVPGWKRLEVDHLILDVNGTLAVDGEPVPGVAERLQRLQSTFSILLLTADTYGRGAELAARWKVPWRRLSREVGTEAAQKRQVVEEIGPHRVVAIGNGRNDAEMLRVAALGIAVLGGEGMACEVLMGADVLVGHPTEALDLLLHPRRLLATLRR